MFNNYVKALHIIFIVTWFSGLFYMVRLFVYHTEANEKPEPERTILQKQFKLMIRRLWMGITWPSAVLTLIFGPWMMIQMGSVPTWLAIKLGFVVGLYLYHFSLQAIYRQQMKGIFRFSSQQLRIWNEVATIFLVAIVMLVVVKQNLSWAWGLLGLFLFVILLISAIKIYKIIRSHSRSVRKSD
ncbi:CopD family protein [Puia sp.]|jgi:putative membrane protein|uniref:CopD family protein n=1 Tax=Puia sp. TaxID=2045100 RepID=UPI002F41885A